MISVLMLTRTLLALLLTLPAVLGWAETARALEPLVVGAERVFSVEWEGGRRAGRPVVNGYVTNEAPYTVRDVQLLVESLDAAGVVVSQQVARIPGHVTGATRVAFEVPAPGPPSASYRVRVFAFDPVDGCGD